MLISGGENVYPAEIERVIREIPGIGDVSIIGIPDDTWGQVPKQVEFIEQLPRSPSGKVLKRKLREL
jgi:long-chain acyl-CoA synthetase